MSPSRATARWMMPVIHPASCFRNPLEVGPLQAHLEGFVRRCVFGFPPSPKLIANPAPGSLRRLAREAAAAGVPLAIDVETGGPSALLPKYAELRAVGVGADLGNGVGLSWDYPMAPEVWREFCEVMQDETIEKVGANLFAYDLPILSRYDAIVRGRIHDIRDARRALVSTSKVGLGPQASYYLVCGPWKADAKEAEDDEKGSINAANIPKEKLLAYNAEDCVRTAQVWTKQRAEFNEDAADVDRRNRLYRQQLRLARVASKMAYDGFPVDELERRNLATQLVQLARVGHEEVTKLCEGRGIIRWGEGGANENDLRALIYLECAKPHIKGFNLEVPFGDRCRTDTGKPAVDRRSLLYLFSNPEIPDELKLIVRAVWRADAPLKARSTFVDSPMVRQAIGSDGRIHPSHNSCGTETGRWSCKRPNLYNLSETQSAAEGSLRGDLPNIRSMYVAPKGFVIVHRDWSQLELAVMADITGDAALRRMLDSGDVHTARVREWFALRDSDPVPKMLRRQGKVVGFASQYSAGVNAVFTAVLELFPDARFDEIARLHALFPKKHPGIAAHWKRSLEEALTRGYNESPIMHRRRYYPSGLRDLPATETSNYAIQGGAADIANCTMVGYCDDPSDGDKELGEGRGMVDALRREFPDAWLAMHTYDSFDVIAPERQAEAVDQLMDEYMQGPYNVGAGPRHFKSDGKIGYRWSEV